MTFTRYAIYYVPPVSAEWSKWATQWLGWDLNRCQSCAQPQFDGLNLAEVTHTPRTYGLHATLKPPFRLAEGCSSDDLITACGDLAQTLAPVQMEGLELARLGRFFALRPCGGEETLNALAADCVTKLDPFRATATLAELEKRRARGLNAKQDALLSRWGYPYVLDQFRFHITLTGKRPKAEHTLIETALTAELCPLLPTPFTINEIALVGEAPDGQFHLIQRYALTGGTAPCTTIGARVWTH